MMTRILHDFIVQKITQIESTGLLKPGEKFIGPHGQPQVDVFRRAGTVESEFDCQTTLENHPVTKYVGRSGQETIKNEELAQACQFCGVSGRFLTQAMFYSLLESRRCLVAPGHVPFSSNRYR